MKKITLLFITLSLLLIAPAKAQLSWANLYGEYKFTADLKITEAGEKYSDELSGDCNVVIEKGLPYDARIVGFAGSSKFMNLNSLSESTNEIIALNPNNPQLWNNIYMTHLNGENPYIVWQDGKQLTEGYGSLSFIYDPDKKEISVPDFAVVEIEGYNSLNTTLIATFKNVKMTLLEAETVEIVDLSGDWMFNASSIDNSTDKDSFVPTKFAVSLEKTGGDNKAYDANFSIDGFNNFTLPATFDGVTLKIEYDNTVVYKSESDTIRLNYLYGSTPKNYINFSFANENTLSLSNGFAFVSDTVRWVENSDTNEKELVDDISMKQWYSAGTLKKVVNGGDGSDTFDWAGTYHVKSEFVVPADGASTTVWPSEFEIVVKYFDTVGIYMITEFMGYDTYTINEAQGFELTPATDGKSANVALNGYYECAFLKMNADGTFLQVTDESSKNNPLKFTLNDDGTITIAPFFIHNLNFSTAASSPVVFYSNMTAVKQESTSVETPDVEDSVVKAIYDLSGRRIETIVAPGIYIVNGKKVIVK